MTENRTLLQKVIDFLKGNSKTPSLIPANWFFRPTAKVIATHKVGNDDTLSHIALRYYGSAIRDYWMVIYEFNKTVIGDNPGIIRPGTELKIPELPANLPMKK